MVLVGKCCFFMPNRPAVILIGFVFMIVSFIGILAATASVLHYLPFPEDPLVGWLFQVCFFVDIHGIVFHTILFILSTILTFAAISNIPPLLVPWLGWSPFVITGILVHMIMVIVKKPDLALPVFSFSVMLLLCIIYGTIVVADYYRETLATTMQLRIFNLNAGELPRLVDVPRTGFCAQFTRGRGGAAATATVATSSMRPLQDNSDRLVMRQKLAQAYERFMTAASMRTEDRQYPTTPTDDLQRHVRF